MRTKCNEVDVVSSDSSPEAPTVARVVDVAVVGAGPAGLMAANLLSRYGASVRVYEAGDDLIDYPRGVGMDDETLRTFQSVGLADDVLPHTVPHQVLAFVDRRWRDLARLQPSTGEFGWPRRNGFVQPLADRVLLDGLRVADPNAVQWASRVDSIEQDASGVTLHMTTPHGASRARARYVIGADGGRSSVRKSLGLRFEGRTAAESWIVVDISDDPLGRPGAYVCADPSRPYVSLSIPHGIRRFEFMLLRGETEAQAMAPGFVERLLAPFIGVGTPVRIIRRRVYTHHSRLSSRFRSGRVMLIGDAAHVMPVWQGQGYNSGIRDAFNLSWKLALVARADAADTLLDSYESERRDHVRAMVDLSTRVGSVVSIRNPLLAALRDAFFRSISVIPRVKSYIVQMRFKPMPSIQRGAVTSVGSRSLPPTVGRLFPQPTVRTRDSGSVKFDDAVGRWFTLAAWNNDPRAILDAEALAALDALGARLVEVRPAVQLGWSTTPAASGDALVVGDVDGSLKDWFGSRAESVVLVRPDRIVGGAAEAHGASAMVRAFLRTLQLDAGEPGRAQASVRTAEADAMKDAS
jgi:3-(3-hydroxy-phenyl)propionate hydroxylase